MLFYSLKHVQKFHAKFANHLGFDHCISSVYQVHRIFFHGKIYHAECRNLILKFFQHSSKEIKHEAEIFPKVGYVEIYTRCGAILNSFNNWKIVCINCNVLDEIRFRFLTL